VFVVNGSDYVYLLGLYLTWRQHYLAPRPRGDSGTTLLQRLRRLPCNTRRYALREQAPRWIEEV
jgi:hypothetical protein